MRSIFRAWFYFALAISVLYIGQIIATLIIDDAFLSYWRSGGMNDDDIRELGPVYSVGLTHQISGLLFSFIAGFIIGKSIDGNKYFFCFSLVGIHVVLSIYSLIQSSSELLAQPLWYLSVSVPLMLFSFVFIVLGCRFASKIA